MIIRINTLGQQISIDIQAGFRLIKVNLSILTRVAQATPHKSLKNRLILRLAHAYEQAQIRRRCDSKKSQKLGDQ